MSSTWLLEDLSCPICLGVFKDPVLMPCSHSFCKACMEALLCRTTTLQCPICRGRCSESSFPLNLALKNVCEGFQQYSPDSKPSVSQNKGSRFLFCMTIILLLLSWPKQHTWKTQQSVLAEKNDNLHRLGLSLNIIWALTCIPTGSFTFLVFHHSHYVSLWHLSRMAIFTVVWLGVRCLSGPLEETLGYCFEPQSRFLGFGTSGLLPRDGESKTSCLREGFQWYGYKVSQEALLLCLCCLLLMEEAVILWQYMQFQGTNQLIMLFFCYLVVWFYLLFVSLVHLTQFPSQQTGAVLGYFAWRVLYQEWFRKVPSW